MTTEGLMLPVSISSDAFKIGAGVVCTYNSFFCTPTFTTQFTFTQFNNTGNNYLVLNIALISLNGKELYICMHILLKITQVFVIFASSLGNFGKYFSKICTLITQYFIYKNADSKILFA